MLWWIHLRLLYELQHKGPINSEAIWWVDYRIKGFLHLEIKCKEVTAEEMRKQGRSLERLTRGCWVQLLPWLYPWIFCVLKKCCRCRSTKKVRQSRANSHLSSAGMSSPWHCTTVHPKLGLDCYAGHSSQWGGAHTACGSKNICVEALPGVCACIRTPSCSPVMNEEKCMQAASPSPVSDV